MSPEEERPSEFSCFLGGYINRDIGGYIILVIFLTKMKFYNIKEKRVCIYRRTHLFM